MTYEEAKQTLEKYASLGSVYGLDGITRLMEALGRPERQLKVIHVAGTNGKGSTVTTLAAILEACGYHTATYTSPEVSTYLDRFRIGGVPADEAVFTTAFEKVEAACLSIVSAGHPHPTIFEMELAIAYLIAIACQAEVMVQETGLGGRLDATNVVEKPQMVVFTASAWTICNFLATHQKPSPLKKLASSKKAFLLLLTTTALQSTLSSPTQPLHIMPPAIFPLSKNAKSSLATSTDKTSFSTAASIITH